MSDPEGVNLPESLDVLVGFLGDEALTTRIARLEHELVGVSVSDIPSLLLASNVDRRLLQSALVVRAQLGRMNDLIHATAIALALPHLLEPDEQLVRPSLAAGNDPSRPFDIETDRRVAEFKLSRWAGADAMRKRQVFKDLVHLSPDASGRQAELYVLGDRPIRFLRTSTSKASWGLDRSPRERGVVEERFGSLERRICDIAADEGAHVALIDLEERLPEVFVGYDSRRLAPPRRHQLQTTQRRSAMGVTEQQRHRRRLRHPGRPVQSCVSNQRGRPGEGRGVATGAMSGGVEHLVGGGGG